jgi:hypothetical protein
MSNLSKAMRTTSSALILAALLSASVLAGASTDTTKKTAAAPVKPTTAAKPGASTGTGTGAAHGAGASGPSANHPTANGPTTHGPVTGGGEAIHSTSTTAHITPRGVTERRTPNGSAVLTRPGGGVRDVHDAGRGMDIHHGLNGGHRVMVERADHSRTLFQRGRPGYVQRPYAFRGHDFARRTYFYHDHVYSHFYHGYAYRGMYLNVYAPGFYYRPAYYGWAYNPWVTPVHYQWGFAASPWYGYYGYYFAPYPAYPSASYWLTDYMISSDLQQAYAAHTEAGEVDGSAPAVGGPAELTPEVKQQIADEVKNQLALENQEAQQDAQQQDVSPASSGIDRMLSDAAQGRQHVFVVGAALDVVDASQTECALSDGDVLALQTAPPAGATTANLVVLASKGGQECQPRGTVTVAMDDLQEMQNHIRETIDHGLQELQAQQGKGGLPAVPPSAQAQPAPAQYAAIAPPDDPNAAAEIQQQAQQGDQAEKEVNAEAAPGGGF